MTTSLAHGRLADYASWALNKALGEDTTTRLAVLKLIRLVHLAMSTLFLIPSKLSQNIWFEIASSQSWNVLRKPGILIGWNIHR
jgi:hypothetical protein